MEQNEKKFLIGLRKLTLETGIAIDSCGCCSGPHLIDVSTEGDYCYEDEKDMPDDTIRLIEWFLNGSNDYGLKYVQDLETS